jgi:Ca2+-binding EF-hand superfamily protein
MFGDTDNNGMISKSELKSITGWSDIIIAPLWLLVDSNKDNQLSLDEFVKVQSIFNLLPGLDSNNDNILTLDELHGLNSNITADQLNAVDKNLNGVLDCEDFLPSIEGEGSVEGVIEGVVEGIPEGTPEGVVEGSLEGTPEGVVEGTLEGIPEGVVEGPPKYS